MELPRHILMTSDTVGGVWTYATDLIDGLAQYGVQVTLFTQGRALSDSQRETAARLHNCDVHETEYKLEWMEEPWADVDAAGRELQELAARVQPDLIHLNDYSHAALHWSQPLLVVGHSCVYSWYDAVKGTAPGAEWVEYWRRVSAGLSHADAVAAPTQAMALALEKHYGPVGGVEVVYNGRSGRGYRSGEKLPLVLGAGRLWDDAKNVKALCQAAPLLEWPVRLAGCIRHPACSVEHVPEGVDFLGELSPRELARQMSEASIFAAPAHYEPFGLTPLEAALSGCALVLGDIPSLREVWGDAATYVRPDDPGALAAAINQMIHFPELRELYAWKARRRARRYSRRRQLRCYLALYRQLLREHRSSLHFPSIALPQEVCQPL